MTTNRVDIVNNDILYYIVKRYITLYRAEQTFIDRLNYALQVNNIKRYLFIDNNNICLSKPQSVGTIGLMRFIKYLIYNKIIVNAGDHSFVLNLNYRFSYFGSGIRIIPTLTSGVLDYQLSVVDNGI